MGALLELIDRHILVRSKRVGELQAELAALEQMRDLAERLEPDPPKPAAPAAAGPKVIEDVPPLELDNRIVKVLADSPTWLRRGEIERLVPGQPSASAVKRSLERLVKLGRVATQGERAGTRYGGPQYLGNAGAAKQQPPPLPPEPPGAWERGDGERSRSCRYGDCIKVARDSGFCADHESSVPRRFTAAAA